MTDEGKTRELNPEDRAIDQAMSQVMATGNEPRRLPGGDAADTAAVREYTELLGLLPYALDPETPADHVKQGIIDCISGTQSAPTSASASTPASSPTPPNVLEDMTLYGTAAEPVAENDSVDLTLRHSAAELPAVKPIQPAAAAAASGTNWGSLAMAAMLAVCIVGMGFLGALVWKQSQQIGLLSDQLASRVDIDPTEAARTQKQAQLLQSRLDMITTVAQTAYPMRRVTNSGRQQKAEGVVYVCGQHQRWYLNLRGLEPPAPGSNYRLWFMTNEGKVDGGILDVRDDASSEMEAMSLPDDTHGFLVTLEKKNSASSEPESLTILLGENAISL